MRMVKLTSGICVNPEFVASIKINTSYNTITIRMQDGEEFHLDHEYGKGVHETYDALVAKLTKDPE